MFDRKPYDIQLTHNQSGSSVSHGFLLAEQEDGGALLYRQTLLPELAPQQRTDAFSYEHRSPLIDLPAAFERWDFGAGFEDAIDTGTLGFRGYNYTRGVDLSWGQRGYLGPEKQTGGSTVEAPLKFVRSSLGLFCMTTRYVYENVSGTWTERYDASANSLTDLEEINNSLGTFLVLGQASGPYLYSQDGVNWTEIASPGSVPAHRNTQTASAVPGTSLTITKPTSTAEDDVLIACIATDNGAVVTAPSGWALVYQFSASVNLAVFWKRAGGAEGSDYTFTLSASDNAVGAISGYTGVRTSGVPYEDTATTVTGSGTTHTNNSVSAADQNRLVVSAFASGGEHTWSPNGSATERADLNATNGPSLQVQDKEVDATTFTASADSSSTSAAYIVSLALVPETGNWNTSRWAIRGSSSGEPLLWLVDVNGDVRNAVDPTTASSWSAADAIQVGQHGVTIAGFEVIDNVFYLVHDGGITSYDGSSVDTVWDARTLKLASNQARPAVGPDNRLYFAFSGTLLRFDPSELTVQKVWPRGPQIGNAELNGTITAITFDEGNCYFALKNAAGNSYVMKLDPFFTVSVGGTSIWPVHTWYYNSSSDIRAMLVVDGASDTFSSTNPQLIIGDGTTADYLILPRSGYRPEDDSNYRFATSQGSAFGSYVNYRAQSFPKWLTRGDIEVDDADSDDTVALQYQVPGGSATTVATANSDGRTTATLSSEVSFTKIRPVLLFDNGANTTSPVLLGVVLHAAPNAPRDRAWVFTVKIANGLKLRNGLSMSRQDAQNQAEFLFNARNEYVTFIDIRGTSHNVKVLDIEPVFTKFGTDLDPIEYYQVTVVEL